MPNPWFRMYSEFANDAKVQTMPFDLQRHLVILFCLKCSDVLGTLRDEEMAFSLHVTTEDLAKIKTIFVEKNFIDKNWNLVHWSDRQYISDSSTERTRRYRERKRTSQERHETVTVTAPDTETDTEQNIKSTSPKQRKRRSEDGMNHSSDPRHVGCKEAIFAYYREHNGGSDPDWNGREGRALGMLLGANPKLSPEGMKRLLDHRGRSEVNHGDRPSLWIGTLSSYRGGPIDRFGKPLKLDQNSPTKLHILSAPGDRQ